MDDYKVEIKIKNKDSLKVEEVKGSTLELEVEGCKLICELTWADEEYLYANVLSAVPCKVKG